MGIPARECLTVFINGLERPGIIVYALRSIEDQRPLLVTTDVWPDAVARPFRLHGGTWEVLRWDVAIDSWSQGPHWFDTVRTALGRLVENGAVVAWIGAEGCSFTDPPYLFHPDTMSGSLLAVMTSVGDFLCPMDPDLPIRSIADDDMRRVRQHARGLADAPS